MTNYIISGAETNFKYVLDDIEDVTSDVRTLLKNGRKSIIISVED